MKLRVYIYCRDEPGNLQEDVIALTEGLLELGIPVHANCNYWLKSTEPGDYLLRHDPGIGPDDCDVVIVSYTWPHWIRMNTFDLVRRPLPEGLFKRGRKYKTVYMDNHDGLRTVSWEEEYRQFDVILRSKLNRRTWHPSNMFSWALGLNNRILDATSNALPFVARRKVLLVNFGASHPYPHGTRNLAARLFDPQIKKIFPLDDTKDDLRKRPAAPYDALMWEQTGNRYSAAYYERLKRSQAVACFSGELIPPMPYRNPECYLVGGNKAKLQRLFYEILGRFDTRAPRSVQWDSFRFWEALAAGCVAFNIDLEYYGVELPAMPVNWKHYVGVNLSRIDQVVTRLQDDPTTLLRVAQFGQKWAFENYSPKAAATRLLDCLGYIRQRGSLCYPKDLSN